MRVKLGEICKFQSGGTPAKGNIEYFGGSIPWITTTALNGGRIDEHNAVDWITEKAIKESAAKIVPAFSIMVGTRVGVGKVAVNVVGMSTNQDIISIIDIDEDKWSKDFLCKFIQAKSGYLNSQARGATIKGIKIDVLAALELPTLLMREQQHISHIIDSVKNMISFRERELIKLDNLIKARFVEMFGDVQHEEKYKGIQLGELCTTMSGGTPSTKFPEYYEGDIPWISTVSLGPNYIDGTTAKGYITQEAVDNSATKLIPAGNILFGTRVGVGKSSLNNVDICTNQDIVAIVGIDESKFNRLFIKHVLDAYQSYYDSIKKGATILGITGDDLKDTLIPNAPIEIQIEFEKFVNQVDKSKVVW